MSLLFIFTGLCRSDVVRLLTKDEWIGAQTLSFFPGSELPQSQISDIIVRGGGHFNRTVDHRTDTVGQSALSV